MHMCCKTIVSYAQQSRKKTHKTIVRVSQHVKMGDKYNV
jgi:hypothetical protein